MIYLIDDNKSQQLESYGCSFIKDGTYGDRLIYMTGIRTPERADFLDELPSKATAIFFHATSKDLDRDGNFLETNETVKKVANAAKEHNIPFVSFSWGHTSHEAIFNNGNIMAMNKRIFYLNFRDFIERYIDEEYLDFRILADGIGYKKEVLIKLAYRLIYGIEKNTNLIDQVTEQCPFGSEINEYLKASRSENTLQSLVLKYSNELTYYKLLDILNRSIMSIRKYGYNLYN
ncbi:hypothetical protein [Rufibacter immobilis]|uniref:hypothetical protein n=1 Tax=Rufibacter immobilis TaxID=1348778 RepID=UPI0035E92D4B